jgi:hypothetical protein
MQLLKFAWVRTVVAEVQAQFRKTEEGERPPLEAVTRGLAKTQLTENTKCMP